MTIRVRDVFCLYPTPRGHVAALRGLTLDVAATERVLVHGPNGSGKTTLLRVLAGERAPSAGTVRVCDVDLIGTSDRERTSLRARSLGIVSQSAGRALRPELTVRDNVALHLRLSGTPTAKARAAADDLLDELGLSALALRRPPTLSGGEAQRAAVCAAVAHRPAIVLADEPTGELDRESAEQVHDLLVAVTTGRGAALLLVSHDRQAERIADRIVRIRDGRISEEWQPGGSGAESLVVDDRGWVRLPEPLRRAAATGDRLHASRDGDRIVLLAGPGSTPTPPPAASAALPTPLPRPHVGDSVAVARGIRVVRAGRAVLDGATLTARAGELIVVRGRSGSGKTTLLRILTGLDRPDDGEVIVGDTTLADLDRGGLARMRRAHIAIAAQGTALLETMDVTANIELARAVRDLPPAPEMVATCADVFGLSGNRHRPVSVLSGGERQRVALARVFASQRTLAVLDEPTSQQDEANAEQVVSVLAAAARAGTAVVAATHDPLLVAAADTVITLGE